MKSYALALLAATIGAGPLAPARTYTPRTAQVAAVGDGYTFKVHYVQGEKFKFKVVTDVVITGGPEGLQNPGPQKTEMTAEQEVLSVKDGVAKIKTTFTGGPEGTPAEQTVEIDERGKVVSSESPQFSGMTSGFPDHPLKVGEEWTADTALPGMPGDAGPLKSTFKFIGLVPREKGDTAAKIDYSATLTGQMNLTGTGSVLLDPANGQLLETSTKMEMKMDLPGGSGSFSMQISMAMTRI